MNHVSTLRLHQLRLGELPAADAGALREHIAACELCARRLDAQLETRLAFARQPIPAALAPVLTPAPTWRDRLAAWRMPLLTLAVTVPAALLASRLALPERDGLPETAPAAIERAVHSAVQDTVATVTPPPSTETRVTEPAPAAATVATPAAVTPEPPREAPRPKARTTKPVAPVAVVEEPTERTKGVVPELEAWIATGESARPLYTGEKVGEGTRVQLRYNAGKRRFVTLAGRDGTGTIEVYGTLPNAGPGLQTAPFALTLDGTAGEQEFFAILTDTKPEPNALMTVLATEPVRMERGEIASVVLPKE